jgi:hypothetical protein
MEPLIQITQCSGRNSKQAPLQNKTEALPIELTFPVLADQIRFFFINIRIYCDM